ncbi:dihydrofolate reductase [Aquibium carbonis]|uniref:Dihydrofolate reductase n=1 Tax=Aquibium carbonis TaxID=2495581 RepID=A0A429YYH7_9HYPH|nr:dihydrofolate reductase [Aquibium carbonis]RST86464.1 dihydrofolate reductase [Aquibium carbonis]
MTDIVIHVAMAENGVIGRDGDMPWTLSTDLKRFKVQTMGKPVVMGRKTFASIGRPLPGRLNIVVTRDPDWRAEGVETVHSLDDALTLARVRSRCMPAADAICIIGGGEIYAQAIDRADRLEVTHVLAAIDGDTRFPAIDPARWRVVSSADHPAGERDSHATRHVVYERAGTSAG